MRTRDALSELWRSAAGRAGLLLLALLAVASVYVWLTYPRDFGSRQWGNPAFWADNPKAAPPAWTNFWARPPRPEHRVLEADEPDQLIDSASGRVAVYRFLLNHSYNEPPAFLALTLGDITFTQRPPLVQASLRRPDGRTVLLYLHSPRSPRTGEAAPFRRYHESPLRVRLSSEASTLSAVQAFLEKEFGVRAEASALAGQVDRALFGVPVDDGRLRFEPLPGEYEVIIQTLLADPGDEAGLVRFVAGGSVYGLMGTDAVGRDLARGLLFGLPVALLIGLSAAVASTAIGTSLGMWSGYAGGRTDMLIQRICDVIVNVPLLPLLIFLIFVLGSNLFVTLLVLVAFSWPGLTILVRSMVLQMRGGQLIESIHSLGASRRRVLFRHVLPQVAPYVLAQLIFLVPAAILAEAGLSFLGLGDPAIPTWGQILESGFRTGAVYVGYWWWIIPPGLLIVLTALAFMLLALGLEPVVSPRLRSSA